MSDDDSWDVWLLGFEPGANPTAGLVGLFGMTEVAAQHIEMTVPRAMKRELPFEEAKALMRSLEGIGAKAELREHRLESARRSVSQQRLEAVRETPSASSEPAPVAATPSVPAALPTAPGPPPAAAPPKPSGAPIEPALGTPVAGELSKTPRNVLLAIIGLVVVAIMAVALASLFEDDEDVGPAPGTPDAEALALMEGHTVEARAYLASAEDGFSRTDRDVVEAFIRDSHAAGAPRIVVADLEDVGGGVHYARALLVEVPDGGAGALREAYEQHLASSPRVALETGERWMIVRFNPR